jgi:hypothetical protein
MIRTVLVSLPVVDEETGMRGSIDVRISEQCATCRNWTEGMTCRAFPRRIPHEILSGEHDHTHPFANDRGIRYEPIPGAAPIIPIPPV